MERVRRYKLIVRWFLVTVGVVALFLTIWDFFFKRSVPTVIGVSITLSILIGFGALADLSVDMIDIFRGFLRNFLVKINWQTIWNWLLIRDTN